MHVGLRTLDAIGATAGAIAAGDLARRVEPAEERTEVGRLGLSLNAMLARLEEAFAEKAMARIEDESARMGRRSPATRSTTRARSRPSARSTGDPSELFDRFWRADPGRGRRRRRRALRGRAAPARLTAFTHATAAAVSLPPVLRKALRAIPAAVVVLGVLAAGAYAVDALLLSDDDTGVARPLRVSVLAPGSFESAHPYAPYYVVPRRRFRDPSELSRLARNKIVTQPESALSKGALAGSPQIIRLSLRSVDKDPVTVEAIRFRVASRARPLRGWFTALSGCQAKPVRRAQADLDARRPAVRYVDGNGVVSRRLALEVKRSRPQVIELRAATARHRVAWTAELSVRDKHGRSSSVAVDDGGRPFRVTSSRSSRGYEPVYGATSITSFKRSRSLARGSSRC